MSENDVDAPEVTNYKRRRTGQSALDKAKEKLPRVMNKITARGFHLMGHTQKMKLIQEAKALLRQVKGSIPHHVFRSYIQIVSTATRRINEAGADNRWRRNREEIQLRMMGRSEPTLPPAIGATIAGTRTSVAGTIATSAFACY
jgi:glycerol-3-phosphate dehydrogenase